MSLSNMMKHLMVLQRCDKTAQSEEGFIDYQGSWHNIVDSHIRCNVQESNLRLVVKDQFAKLEDQSEHRIYYKDTSVYNILQDTVAVRAIVWRADFRKKFDLTLLTNNGNKDLFNIYTMKSNVNITEGQIGTKIRVYILRCEKTTKMDL